MGLFGNDSSKTYSTTNLSQVDESVQVAGDAQNILGSGAHLALTSTSNVRSDTSSKTMAAGAGSFVVDATNTTLGDIIFNQFPEAVQNSISDLLMSNDAITKIIGESISRQQQLESGLTKSMGETLAQQQQFGVDLTKSIDATLTPPESDGKSLSPSIILGLIVAGGLALIMAKRLIKK
ncbi:MAG: hypothetical protein IMZ71_00940 [Chloroflexi bacterium]|nr:hypothetical protein [Chloroflexota bacterium]